MLRRRESDGGQELVEYAIVFPVLMLLVLGIIELGRIMYSYSAISNAAREGARLAVLPSSRDDITDGIDLGKQLDCTTYAPQNPIVKRVCDRAMALSQNQLRVTLSQPNPVIVQVDVEYDGPFLTDLILQAVNQSGLLLRAAATMRLE
jgi:Flp pilus assembly protein TadG